MPTVCTSRGTPPARAHLLIIALALCAASPAALAGTWTKLAHNAPGAVELMHLMPDGTVMCAQESGPDANKGWYRLTPDIHGSYVNGTWTVLASMHDTRLYYPSEVLTDGRLFVAGGEYGTGGPYAEVYDPLTDTWTSTLPPASIWNPAADNFYDCNSEILPDGKVLVMPVGPFVGGAPLRYDPSTDTWSNAGKLKVGYYQDEATWVKLADDSILTIDPFGTHSERYIPGNNQWVNDSTVPVQMYDSFGSELGAALLLPNGNAFYLGATGHTAIYTPSGSPIVPGVWTAGPDLPNGTGTPDAPAAMLVTGNILCAVSPAPYSGNPFPGPTTFYEYDYLANAYTPEDAPTGSNDNTATFATAMLDLPDGTVLYSHFGGDLYVYTPDGAPLAAGKPVIGSITANPDGSWHLTGTGLTGISEGASYGDDLQMNTNFPLVRLAMGSIVYYARAYNWSSTGVQTGATPITTEFSVPATVPGGQYSLVVVANGIASDPVPFTQVNGATWTSLGSGLDGVFGVPLLDGHGTQVAGSPAEIDLILANPSSPAALFVSLTTTPTPFKGGTLLPIPLLVSLPLTTSGVGTIALPFTWPSGVPPAFSTYCQYAIQDPTAVHGVALSNALQATTP